MKPATILSRLFILTAAFSLSHAAEQNLRPPAVPLIAYDPYLSIWSDADLLTGDVTRHWTDQPQPLVSLIRIDGKAYRLMGNAPKDLPAFPQAGLRVTPTRTIYQFDDSHVQVTLTFMTPSLPDQLDILARPVTYLTWAVKSVDGQKHAVSIYDSTSSTLTVDIPDRPVTWSREAAGPLTALKCGSVGQTLFNPRGDRVRIDWGYAYAAAPTGQSRDCIGASETLLQGFVANGTLPVQDETPPRAVKDKEPVMSFVFDLGSVGSEEVSRHLLVAYDELYEVKFAGQNLLPYWKRNGATITDVLQSAESDYPKLVAQCGQFDDSLMDDMTKVGGAHYAQICALAYRQCLAGCGLAADANKQPLLFTKENTSNGDIATVDVIFPMEPIFLFLCPSLAKASVAPPMLYAASERWKFPNAPHDLGTYPVASASGEAGEAMPVEESGDLLILCDAIAKVDGNANFADFWWPQLTQWAKYLEQYGEDPGNQLCTDDFMGHLAHNSNLSVKAILALAAYGDLCQRRGDAATADKYRNMAKADAENWMHMADDGDHYRLAFDKPNTWSQLYNLVWDKLLDLNVFPPSVAQKEIAYYKTQIQPYGLPLDSRTKTTKTDWTFWTTTLADNPGDFEFFIDPVYKYLNETTSRQALADSYHIDTGKGGFHARPVVGGLFIKMLSDEAIWKKWAAADTLKPGPWAPVPPLPIISRILPTEAEGSLVWRYTDTQPAADWMSPTFDDSAWQQGKADVWKSKLTANIWIRAKVTLPTDLPPDVQWIMKTHGNGETYLNGVSAGLVSSHGDFELEDISATARDQLQPGKEVVIAAHVEDHKRAEINLGLGAVKSP
jgi:hypothetical protein